MNIIIEICVKKNSKHHIKSEYMHILCMLYPETSNIDDITSKIDNMRIELNGRN